MSLLVERIEGIESDVDDVAAKANEIPVLRKEVGLLREAVNRNTTALYQAAGALLITGVLGVLTALILKGVIG